MAKNKSKVGQPGDQHTHDQHTLAAESDCYVAHQDEELRELMLGNQEGDPYVDAGVDAGTGGTEHEVMLYDLSGPELRNLLDYYLSSLRAQLERAVGLMTEQALEAVRPVWVRECQEYGYDAPGADSSMPTYLCQLLADTPDVAEWYMLEGLGSPEDTLLSAIESALYQWCTTAIDQLFPSELAKVTSEVVAQLTETVAGQ